MTASIAHREPAALGGRGSIPLRQRRDHARLDAMMNRYLAADTPDGDREGLWQDIAQLVFSHAFAEETVLWPVLRRLVPDGDDPTRPVEEEHQAINELIARVEKSAGDPRRGAWIRQAFDLIRKDIQDEENELLPRLRYALSDRPDPFSPGASPAARPATRRQASRSVSSTAYATSPRASAPAPAPLRCSPAQRGPRWSSPWACAPPGHTHGGNRVTVL